MDLLNLDNKLFKLHPLKEIEIGKTYFDCSLGSTQHYLVYIIISHEKNKIHRSWGMSDRYKCLVIFWNNTYKIDYFQPDYIHRFFRSLHVEAG